MALAYSTQRILEILGNDCEAVGAYEGTIQGIASLAEAQAGDLSFLGNPKYRAAVADSQASVLLVPKDYEQAPKPGQLHLKLENPSFALALICRDIELTLLPKPPAGIHPSAVVEADAEVSPEASIGAFCYIGSGAKVGAAVLASHVSVGRSAQIKDEVQIGARVSVGDYCVIGERNRLLPGCVIGSDGYGYEYFDGAHQRVPQIGNVVIAADVDVGANSTIDRARFGSTQIGAGTKIDNQVQIAHNVRVGQHCLIVAQVGISGSTVLGDGVVVGGQAGLAGHLKIGSGAMIAGGTAVVSDIEPQLKVRGYPAMPMMLFNRMAVLQRKLPDLFKRFDQLEKTVKCLAPESK
ncbi:UDP-3-O-(3-hydroxymyristoyl)glucosamine N-acyltransferase [Coraliomargarita algicola]|uniref:UDP-3-O-acylglucosamine N-acyltransferase n=1 Tax=Coraliomargarita algicola TaxID=3092156 RepID=A0ABZ0RN79_9BACT|nr:UDP-3-O-(3-hydroxymyristoyl)glucosamine N-acyltransferase [Coraliomargarita sp. J2-16]WPJ97577.1 UDP-3-O-(3-hydroxymyristoyl)glucosamine N-acyltransferase [Coraliomargarita sp. J2-16]